MTVTAVSPAPAKAWITVAVGALVVPMIGLGIGTGGAATLDYVRERGSMGYPYAPYESRHKALEAFASQTPVENITRIRSVLGCTVTDVAGMLGVSRQAIYDWQAGKAIAAENASRLSELTRAADSIAGESLALTPRVLRRPIRDGKNFFELVREGGSAEGAAGRLVEIVRGEARERETLKKRLAGRARPVREAFEDIGSPMLEEKG
jgi:transcriptional regulator with XRE-family HTH domain